MYYVYRIRSRHNPDQTFVGVTRDLNQRLSLHNTGQVDATREYRPWRVSFYAAFSRKKRAEAFYEFLISPAGAEFGDQHFWQPVEE